MIQSETSPNKEDEATITEAASEMEAVPDPASEMEAVPDPDPGPPALGARVDGGPDPAPGAEVVTDTPGRIRSTLRTLNLMEGLHQCRPSMGTRPHSRKETDMW